LASFKPQHTLHPRELRQANRVPAFQTAQFENGVGFRELPKKLGQAPILQSIKSAAIGPAINDKSRHPRPSLFELRLQILG
jgi:hypothetical protein